MLDHVAEVGVMQDSRYEDDADYFREVVAGQKKQKAPVLTSLPVRLIAASLEYRPTAAPEGSPEYRRHRLQDRADCVLCNSFSHWNRAQLQEHYRSHAEVRSFMQGTSNEAAAYERLKRQKVGLEEQIVRLKEERLSIDRQLRSFDLVRLKQRQRQSAELLKLLH